VAEAGPAVRPWRLWSLRARLTIAATALLAAGLAIASLLLATTISRSLVSGLDSGALASGRQVAELVDEGRPLPEPVPIGSEATAVIQVVDADDRVRAASANADRLVPLVEPADLARVRAGERIAVDGERAGLAGQLRVLGVPAGPDDDPRTVLVASGLTVLQDSQHALRNGLLIGAPLLLVALALVSWRVIGWTLAPVEALRRGADQISAAEITSSGTAQRLPVPDARDEVRRLAETLNDMLGRLAAASASQRGFVSDAAHELRSPLASLRTQLEVAARLGGAETTELATDALLDVARLSTLVDDLLLLARLDEAPGRTRRREPVDLGELAATVVGRYAAARVPVTVAGPAAELVVPGDPNGLTRVLANLVDNAVRHASAQVTVTVTGTEGQGELIVADDGPGIPVADRDRVFDRFTRLDDARARESGGAGLGLAIVRELVRAHGGTVTLRDAAPGLEVHVALPASAAAPERKEATTW
jgi:signal transduction histidine kinase